MRYWFWVINVGVVLSAPGTPTSSMKRQKEEFGATLRTVNAHGDIEPFGTDTVRRTEVQVTHEAHSSDARQQRHREGFVLETNMKSTKEHTEKATSNSPEPMEESLEKQFPSIASLLKLWGKALVGDYSGNDSQEELMETLDGNNGKPHKDQEQEERDAYKKQQQERRDAYKKQQQEQKEAYKQRQKNITEAYKNITKEQQKIYKRAAQAAHKTQQAAYRKQAAYRHPLHKGKERDFYAPADRDMWIKFGVAALFTLCFDIFAVRYVALKLEERIGIPSWTAHLAFSLVVAFAFSSYMFFERGETACTSWLNGFLMEMILSVDNLLVFSMIFTSWKTPVEARYKPLVWGISGAVLIRFVLFSAFQFFLDVHIAFAVLLAAFLIYTGTMAILEEEDDDEDVDYQNSVIIAWISKVCPTIPRYEKDFFVCDGKLTLLFFVLVCIEVTDVVFAIDSVSAKVAQIPDGYTAYTSTVFAMLTLRSLFWILDSFIRTFAYVKYGIAGLMYYIAVKLVFPKSLDVSDGTFFKLISFVFAVCVILTYVYPPAEKNTDNPDKGPAKAASKYASNSTDDSNSTAASSTDLVGALKSLEHNPDLKK